MRHAILERGPARRRRSVTRVSACLGRPERSHERTARRGLQTTLDSGRRKVAHRLGRSGLMLLLCSGCFCGSPAPPPSVARARDGVLKYYSIAPPPPPVTPPLSPWAPPSLDTDVILGRSDGCPTGYAKLTTVAECRAGVDQMRLPWWDTDLVATEANPSWPAGCYSMVEGYCTNVPDCTTGVFFNRDPDGHANLDARSLCGKTFMPVAPPAPPPLVPSSALPWGVPLVALLACAFCAATVFAYHRHRSKREYDLRRSRDRVQLDLQLLAHQLEQVEVIEPALTDAPPPTDQPVAQTFPQPVAPTISRLAPSRGGTSSSCTEGTNSELGRSFFPSSSEAAVTLSEVSGAGRLLLGRGRGRGGRPLHPYAASSVSSQGTAATEANIHLLSTTDVEQRYNLDLDLAALDIHAPVPQFGPFLAVLSERDRAELLVSVGRDGRLVYASTGEPVVPSSPHSDNACTYMFVVLAPAAVYIRVDDPLTFHHDLAGNAPVIAAGEMFFSDGRLLSINNRSGHYRPPPECLQMVMSLLRSRGAQTAVPFKEFHYDVTGIQNGVPGSERRRAIR